MCGVAGILDWLAPDAETVRKMVAALRHRGPDANGVIASGTARLAIRACRSLILLQVQTSRCTLDKFESLSHSKWECNYHAVFIPKRRRKMLYGELRRHLGEVFRRLAEQRECRIEEGHLMLDQVHMMIAIPPKHAVSQVVGYIKGKSAIHVARVYGGIR